MTSCKRDERGARMGARGRVTVVRPGRRGGPPARGVSVCTHASSRAHHGAYTRDTSIDRHKQPLTATENPPPPPQTRIPVPTPYRRASTRPLQNPPIDFTVQPHPSTLPKDCAPATISSAQLARPRLQQPSARPRQQRESQVLCSPSLPPSGVQYGR